MFTFKVSKHEIRYTRTHIFVIFNGTQFEFSRAIKLDIAVEVIADMLKSLAFHSIWR